MHLALVAAVLGLVAIGCATASRDRAWVSDALRERTGHGLSDDRAWPEGVRLADGVDEDEAAAIALWRSPAYRFELARLTEARANFDESARLVNPQLSLLAPMGPVSAIATLLAPLESLWQLPQRTEAAARELESVAESLVQVGLDLVRDAKVAHADRALAEDRVAVRSELMIAWAEIARVAEVRGQRGEISSADAAVTSGEARIAADALATAQSDREILRARLRAVLGVSSSAPSFEVTFARALPPSPPALASLLRLARRSRPDARAAELAIAAAVVRAGWERSRVIQLAAQVEGHWNADDTLAVRAGGRIELPIFSQNQGGIGRAEAEIERRTARLDEVRQRAVAEVVEASTRLAQALRSLDTYRRTVLPSLEEGVRASTRRYELGADPYFVVFDALRRRGDARLREVELVAEARRALALLERAVGTRIGSGTP